MSSEEIELHFAQMEELAEILFQAADKMQHLLECEGTEQVNKLKAAWISENADIFAGKERNIIEQIIVTAQHFKELAEEISKKAKQIYDVEMWNCLVARARSYR